MGHVTSKNYYKLQERLDMNAQGAPKSESLFRILEILFSKDEADKVSRLPIKPFDIKLAAKRWKLSKVETEKILNELADKGILVDLQKGNKRTFILAPTMAGFFEFSLMRTDGRFDRKILSELFYKYINEEDDFMRDALMQKTSICRTFVHEQTVKEEDRSEILDYDRATEVINTASCITVGTCYCRHKMEHVGKACDAPQDVCLTFNNSAESLSKHGIARKISKKEAKEVLDKCVNLGLVQIGDNVQKKVNWICNCCGCCCEALLAYKKLGYRKKIHGNFYAEINLKACSNCGVCKIKCPVDAVEIKNSRHFVDLEKCIGCGVCHRFCAAKSIDIKKRDKPVFVPMNSFERCILNAIEKGKLQNYIFDNYALWTNEIMRHFLGVILSLTQTRFLIANDQLKSRFISAMRRVAGSSWFRKLYDEGKG